MKQALTFLLAAGITLTTATAQRIDNKDLKSYDRQLEDVTELIDTNQVKAKLTEVETAWTQDKSELNTVRLGLIYHEVALTLSFLTKTGYKGYARKSYDVLSGLFSSKQTTPALLPIVAAYRASALSLVGAETKKVSLLSVAFAEFESTVKNYADVSPYPEFLRGSVAENLPWFFFRKRKFARPDFDSIVAKQDANPDYANWKLMSFTYWAWARQHQSAKDRTRAISYLDKAILLDPTYLAGRQRAELLKAELLK